MGNDDAIFDLKKALEQVGGDRELLKEIIGIYCEEYPKQLLQIQQAIGKNDNATVGKVAHTVKGAVGNFGAKSAFEAALCLEKIGKSGEPSKALSAFGALKEKLEQLEQKLKKT